MHHLRIFVPRVFVRQFLTLAPVSVALEPHFTFPGSPVAAPVFAPSGHTITRYAAGARLETLRSDTVHERSWAAATLRVQRQLTLEFRQKRDLARQLARLILNRNERREERSLAREVVFVHASRPAGAQPQRVDAGALHAGRMWPPSRSAFAGRAEPHAAPALAVNIDQIAETVMRQLDRRIESWRERMGRR
jgi:hypothetical protein